VFVLPVVFCCSLLLAERKIEEENVIEQETKKRNVSVTTVGIETQPGGLCTEKGP